MSDRVKSLVYIPVLVFIYLVILPYQSRAEFLQFGAAYPIMFINGSNDFNHSGSNVTLKDDGQLDGYTGLLGINYLFIGVDKFSRGFRFDTDEQEKIKLKYENISIGLFLNGKIWHMGLALGFGESSLECTKICDEDFTKPEIVKGDLISFQFGNILTKYLAFYIELKNSTFDSVRLYSSSDDNDYYEFTNPSGMLVTVGLFIDF